MTSLKLKRIYTGFIVNITDYLSRGKVQSTSTLDVFNEVKVKEIY